MGVVSIRALKATGSAHVEAFSFGRLICTGGTGAKKSGDGIVGVSPEAKVELGVERVPEMELHDDLARRELRRESAQSRLVVIGRSANGELRPELLGQSALQADDGLIADLVFLRQETIGFAELVLRQPLHPDEQTALLSRSARPLFNQRINGFPSAQIEISDAEVRSLRNLQRFAERWKEIESDVIKDSWH